MRFWKTTEGLKRVRNDVRLIHDLMRASFTSRDERMPRMLCIGTCETDADGHVYEIHFALAPDVVLRVLHGSTEDAEDGEFPTWLAPEAASDADAAIISYLSMGTDNLSNILHDLRLRARRILSRHAVEGGSGRLVDVQLTAERRMAGPGPTVRIRLEGLDTSLRRKVDDIAIGDLDRFDAGVERWSEAMALRFAARGAFEEAGASGSIDMLALAALRTFTDPQIWLRSLAEAGLPKQRRDILIFPDDGDFRSQRSDAKSGMSWSRDLVMLRGALPVAALAASKGRPITDLVQHPLLSNEMTIIEATNDIYAIEPSVSMRIRQPRLLFCSGSGRTWRDDA